MADASCALELLRVSKRYGPVVALNDVSLTVRAGTVHALLGENGAGKTTLMHVAYGMVRPDAGRISVGGHRAHITSPQHAIAHGVGMVHQHFTLVPAMTVAENVALGGRGLLRRSEMVARVRRIASRTGFALDPDARIDTLPVGAQQRVEIAKALAHGATLLILDEPTAVLAPAEVDDLIRWLRAYVSEGHSAVIITHKLREALAVADDVTVLRHSRVVFCGAAATTSAQALTEAMIGSATATVASSRRYPVGEIVIEATDLALTDPDGRTRIRDASFAIRGGELVGIAAVEGAGQRELLRALADRYPVSAGRLKRPTLVGFIPEDRHRDAVLLDRALVDTVALRGAGVRAGMMPWNALRTRTEELLGAFDIRASGARANMRELSGGNQQKLVLARELSATSELKEPEALVVENPTRGLDVRATADVHARLHDACARGAAVVFYSSDLDEVLSLATRVLVLYAGTVREIAVDREAVGRAMLGLP
ncbi:MAG: transporter related protein [Gemmatimonadetes bacterium]|nr:transporter related protein [Gemmatimonadota bacterium]